MKFYLNFKLLAFFLLFFTFESVGQNTGNKGRVSNKIEHLGMVIEYTIEGDFALEGSSDNIIACVPNGVLNISGSFYNGVTVGKNRKAMFSYHKEINVRKDGFLTGTQEHVDVAHGATHSFNVTLKIPESAKGNVPMTFSGMPFWIDRYTKAKNYVPNAGQIRSTRYLLEVSEPLKESFIDNNFSDEPEVSEPLGKDNADNSFANPTHNGGQTSSQYKKNESNCPLCGGYYEEFRMIFQDESNHVIFYCPQCGYQEVLLPPDYDTGETSSQDRSIVDDLLTDELIEGILYGTPAAAAAVLAYLLSSVFAARRFDPQVSLQTNLIERTPEDIFNNPRLHERFLSEDGNEYVYYKPVGDLSPNPFWVKAEDYENEMYHLNRGDVFYNGLWMSKENAGWMEKSIETDRERVATESFERNLAFNQKQLERQFILDRLERMEEVAQRHGMSKDYANDNMAYRIEQIKEDINANLDIDYDKINQIRNYIDGRLTGRIGLESNLAEQHEAFNAGVYNETMLESLRNISTMRNADGSFSLQGMAGRLFFGGLTAGKSELVFAPVKSLFTLQEAIDNGASGIGATLGSIGKVVLRDVAMRGISIGAKGIGGAAKSAYSSGKLGNGVLGLKQGVQKGVSEQMRQVSELQNFLGLNKAPLSSPDKILLKKFNKAIDSGNTNEVMALYLGGGQKKLVRLQQGGHIAPNKALKCNAIIQQKVDSYVHSSTNETIKQFQEKTGVKLKEVIVADSGSGAKGAGTMRMSTDHDRTFIPKFDAADVNKYSKIHKISPQEAYNKLSSDFAKAHGEKVSQKFIKHSLDADKDIGYAGYDRIGSGAGQADAYPTGFTSARQATSGSAKVYKVDASGKIKTPIKMSGQTAVDQELMNNAAYGTKSLSGDAVRLSAKETKSILEQQIKSVGSSANPEKISKAVDRFSKQLKVGATSKDALGSKCHEILNNTPNKLLEASRAIRNNPTNVQETLTRYGYKDIDHFLGEGRSFFRMAQDSIL